jgi:NADH-quinone oxidoreductase E subunit
MRKHYDLNASYQPETFAFRDGAVVDDILSRYPQAGKRSAVMPLLWLAQKQVADDGAKVSPTYGGWIPRAAMDEIARIIGQPPIKVYEVATFYSMYNLEPVGRHILQVCTTTPCWLQGSDGIMKACKSKLGIGNGETTKDGMFSLIEVECLGACANAPMMQINDEYYEDLTPERTVQMIDQLASGQAIPPGPQNGRKGSMSIAGPTTLQEQAKKAGVA